MFTNSSSDEESDLFSSSDFPRIYMEPFYKYYRLPSSENRFPKEVPYTFKTQGLCDLLNKIFPKLNELNENIDEKGKLSYGPFKDLESLSQSVCVIGRSPSLEYSPKPELTSRISPCQSELSKKQEITIIKSPQQAQSKENTLEPNLPIIELSNTTSSNFDSSSAKKDDLHKNRDNSLRFPSHFQPTLGHSSIDDDGSETDYFSESEDSDVERPPKYDGVGLLIKEIMTRNQTRASDSSIHLAHTSRVNSVHGSHSSYQSSMRVSQKEYRVGKQRFQMQSNESSTNILLNTHKEKVPSHISTKYFASTSKQTQSNLSSCSRRVSSNDKQTEKGKLRDSLRNLSEGLVQPTSELSLSPAKSHQDSSDNESFSSTSTVSFNMHLQQNKEVDIDEPSRPLPKSGGTKELPSVSNLDLEVKSKNPQPIPENTTNASISTKKTKSSYPFHKIKEEPRESDYFRAKRKALPNHTNAVSQIKVERQDEIDYSKIKVESPFAIDNSDDIDTLQMKIEPQDKIKIEPEVNYLSSNRKESFKTVNDWKNDVKLFDLKSIEELQLPKDSSLGQSTSKEELISYKIPKKRPRDEKLEGLTHKERVSSNLSAKILASTSKQNQPGLSSRRLGNNLLDKQTENGKQRDSLRNLPMEKRESFEEGKCLQSLQHHKSRNKKDKPVVAENLFKEKSLEASQEKNNIIGQNITIQKEGQKKDKQNESHKHDLKDNEKHKHCSDDKKKQESYSKRSKHKSRSSKDSSKNKRDKEEAITFKTINHRDKNKPKESEDFFKIEKRLFEGLENCSKTENRKPEDSGNSESEKRKFRNLESSKAEKRNFQDLNTEKRKEQTSKRVKRISDDFENPLETEQEKFTDSENPSEAIKKELSRDKIKHRNSKESYEKRKHERPLERDSHHLKVVTSNSTLSKKTDEIPSHNSQQSHNNILGKQTEKGKQKDSLRNFNVPNPFEPAQPTSELSKEMKKQRKRESKGRKSQQSSCHKSRDKKDKAVYTEKLSQKKIESFSKEVSSLKEEINEGKSHKVSVNKSKSKERKGKDQEEKHFHKKKKTCYTHNESSCKKEKGDSGKKGRQALSDITSPSKNFNMNKNALSFEIETRTNENVLSPSSHPFVTLSLKKNNSKTTSNIKNIKKEPLDISSSSPTRPSSTFSPVMIDLTLEEDTIEEPLKSNENTQEAQIEEDCNENKAQLVYYTKDLLKQETDFCTINNIYVENIYNERLHEHLFHLCQFYNVQGIKKTIDNPNLKSWKENLLRIMRYKTTTELKKNNKASSEIGDKKLLCFLHEPLDSFVNYINELNTSKGNQES